LFVDVVAALFLTFVFVDVSVVAAAYVFAIALVYEKKSQTNAEWYSLLVKKCVVCSFVAQLGGS
jgi:hypothetical protein